MRLFKFFEAWALTEPLAWISKQRSSVLHANLQLTAVGGQCATGAKKVALRTAKLIVPGLLIVLSIGSAAAAPTFQAAGTTSSRNLSIFRTPFVHLNFLSLRNFNILNFKSGPIGPNQSSLTPLILNLNDRSGGQLAPLSGKQ